MTRQRTNRRRASRSRDRASSRGNRCPRCPSVIRGRSEHARELLHLANAVRVWRGLVLRAERPRGELLQSPQRCEYHARSAPAYVPIYDSYLAPQYFYSPRYYGRATQPPLAFIQVTACRATVYLAITAARSVSIGFWVLG